MQVLNRFKRTLTGPAAGERVRAVWNGVTLAESDQTIKVEGNHYFPPESVDRRYLMPSSKHTICYWKGTASYYDVEANGKTNRAAAWYYPEPADAAAGIRDHVAFWGGVRVEAVAGGDARTT